MCIFLLSLFFLLSANNVTCSSHEEQKKVVLQQLYAIGCLKLGNFKLKNGTYSPFYLDVRHVVSYPQILQSLAECLSSITEHVSYDVMCGVPYAALPIATALSLHNKKPMIIKRKETKQHGTQKMIEGVFQQGNNCLIIEDIITTGGSIGETISDLENAGLKVTDIVVCIDREQSGVENVRSKGYRVHALYTISEIIATLLDTGLITRQQHTDISTYLRNNSFANPNL